MSDELAAESPGIIVDLIAKKLESYGMRLMLKRIRDATDKQCYICADGDTEVIIK